MSRVFFTPNSSKLLQKLTDKKLKIKIDNAKKLLANNPYIGKKLKGELTGQYTLRIWPYRIVYFIKPNKDIVITDIGHRKDIYR